LRLIRAHSTGAKLSSKCSTFPIAGQCQQLVHIDIWNDWGSESEADSETLDSICQGRQSRKRGLLM